MHEVLLLDPCCEIYLYGLSQAVSEILQQRDFTCAQPVYSQCLEACHNFLIRFSSHMANRMTVGSPVRMQLVALPKPEETKTGMEIVKLTY